jgi:rRNA maturation RNase YbeY
MYSVLIKSAKKFDLAESEVRRMAGKVLETFFDKNLDLELSLYFVDSKTIHEMNREYRHLNETASILSFSQQELSPTERLQAKGQAYTTESRLEFNNAPDKVLRLGDLVICLSVAQEKDLTLEDLLKHGIKSLFSQIPSANSLRVGHR